MGNALSWIISAIFGDKEARILILGLDNGARSRIENVCVPSSFASLLPYCALLTLIVCVICSCTAGGLRYCLAGKTSILYRLKEGTFHSTVPSKSRRNFTQLCTLLDPFRFRDHR
jgi:hypothetical protein